MTRRKVGEKGLTNEEVRKRNAAADAAVLRYVAANGPVEVKDIVARSRLALTPVDISSSLRRLVASGKLDASRSEQWKVFSYRLADGVVIGDKVPEGVRSLEVTPPPRYNVMTREVYRGEDIRSMGSARCTGPHIPSRG